MFSCYFSLLWFVKCWLLWSLTKNNKIDKLYLFIITLSVLRIHLIFMLIRIRIHTGKKCIRIQVMNISLRFTDFFLTAELSKYFPLFSHNFMLNLDEPFRDQEIFIVKLFLTVQNWVLSVFSTVFGWYLTPWIGSVDPHIFADPDTGNQNLADPTDPKH